MTTTDTNATSALTHRDWQEAHLSQGACNLSGLAHSLSKVVTKIWEEARQQGQGTDWVNQHPIVRLYVEQMAYLAGGRDYFEASKIVHETLTRYEAAATL